ncbi:MAG: NAD(P)H-dependent oxidoreductase [Candidatus Diapherotrites archaeon]|nr:NAD(P)H-dependent oxidoreductase [Candidatus Diapherotrites archaeon]
MFAPVFLGTARKGRQSEKAALFVLEAAKKAGFESEIIDVKDFALQATDNSMQSEKAKALAEKVSRADAIVIVSPEYNHGYPGELKLVLDLLYGQYWGKPAGICGVSAGPLGGARAVEQLRQVAVELHMWPIREALYFPKVQELFDEKGRIKDSAYDGLAAKFFSELKRHAEICAKGKK